MFGPRKFQPKVLMLHELWGLGSRGLCDAAGLQPRYCNKHLDMSPMADSCEVLSAQVAWIHPTG